MAKIGRQVKRYKEMNLSVGLAVRVTKLEAYIKSLDKLLAIFDKHFPAVMKEAFPEAAPQPVEPPASVVEATEAPSVVPPLASPAEEVQS